MKPEEKALIESAVRLYNGGVMAYGWWGTGSEFHEFHHLKDAPIRPSDWDDFGAAVRAYQQPRRRWTVAQKGIGHGYYLRCDAGNALELPETDEARALLEGLAALLNERKP